MKERLYTSPDLGCEWYPRPERRQTLAVAENGSIWHWDCGWRLMHRPRGSKSYQPKPNSPVLGRQTFERNIKILQKDQDKGKAKEVLLGVEKPGQPWRRFVGGCLYEHFLYGNVKVRATDGMHAVIEDIDGMLLTVMFDNLKELKPQAEIKPKKDPSETKTKAKPSKPKMDVAALVAKYS